MDMYKTCALGVERGRRDNGQQGGDQDHKGRRAFPEDEPRADREPGWHGRTCI